MRTFKIAGTKDWELSFKKDKVATWTIILWLAFLSLGAIYLLISFQNLPASVPLFFSRPWGEAQLANKLYLLVLPAGSLFLGATNICFALSLHRDNQFLSRILLGIAPVLSFLATVSVFNIINLVK